MLEGAMEGYYKDLLNTKTVSWLLGVVTYFDSKIIFVLKLWFPKVVQRHRLTWVYIRFV